MNTFKYKKSIQAINLFAELEGGSINYMKAIKLIWLADRYHFRNHGKTITGDIYFALKNGPVASCTYDIVKNENLSSEELEYRNLFVRKRNRYIIESIDKSQSDVFSKKELSVLNLIYNSYSHYSHFQLSNFSHLFPEWKYYENHLKFSKREKIDMNLFFENVSDKTNLFVNSEEEIMEMKEYQTTFYPIYSNQNC